MSEGRAGPVRAASRRKAAAGTFLGSGVNTLILSIQALILMPLCERIIGGRIYGAWLASGDFLYWIMAFDLGLPSLMIQRIGAAHGRGDRVAVGEYFGTGVIFLAAVGVLIGLAAVLIAPLMPLVLGLRGAEAQLLTACIRLGGAATCIVLASNAVLGYTRGVQDTAAFNVFSILGTLAMFAVSATTLLRGSGLWSIPYGLLTRAFFAVLGSLWVVAAHVRSGELSHCRPTRVVSREYATILPASALGGISYALMSQSESIVIGILLGPEKVPIFNFTRKGAEVLRALLDTVAFASYGAFAHLIASAERARSMAVHAQITTLRLSLAIGMAAVYLALNHSFVATWAGPGLYGGPLLTVLIGAQIVAAGASNLMNYLYRATGRLMRGSVAQFAESLVRVPLMVGGVLWFGYAGIPAAAILTSVVACIILLRWTRDEMSPFARPVAILNPIYSCVLVALFGVGILGDYSLTMFGWKLLIPAGAILSAAAVGIVLVADPNPIWQRRRSMAA